MARWSGLYLRWDEWSVHDRLTEVAVSETLAALLGPGHGVVASRQPWPVARLSARARGRPVLCPSHPRDGPTRRSEIAVEGAGLGYLGRHAIAVVSALPGHCPQVYGLADGLLYREWIPGALSAPDAAELALAVTDYVVARGRAMRVGADPTLGLRGREPAWEVAAGLLSRLFGRLAPVGQVVLLDRIVQRLLRVENPSVPDGQTHVRYWIATRPVSPLHKVNFHRGSFSNREHTCYDAVFDLAGAAADPPSDDFEGVLRATYRHHTGHTIDPERWLHTDSPSCGGYAAPRRSGRHCFRTARPTPCTTTCPAFSRRRIGRGRRGQRPALCDRPRWRAGDRPARLSVRHAIGRAYPRSERPWFPPGPGDRAKPPRHSGAVPTIWPCGGVAEYGAALYDHRTGHRTDMRDRAARATIEQLRHALARHRDIEVDERHRYIVRTRSGSGPIPKDLAREIGSSVDGLLRIVHGEGQTDFVPVGVDKGTGLRALAAQLRGRVVLAVGDSIEDLTMFAGAGLGCAPRRRRATACTAL